MDRTLTIRLDKGQDEGLTGRARALGKTRSELVRDLIWAAAMHSGRFFRFNPRTERWIDYMLPEPYSHNRRTWIDNSTTPVTVWYVDHNGYMVRIQPLD